MRNLQRFSSLTRNLLTPLNKKLKKMTKSALQIARAAYQPKLPKALASGAVKAIAILCRSPPDKCVPLLPQIV